MQVWLLPAAALVGYRATQQQQRWQAQAMEAFQGAQAVQQQQQPWQAQAPEARQGAHAQQQQRR